MLGDSSGSFRILMGSASKGSVEVAGALHSPAASKTLPRQASLQVGLQLLSYQECTKVVFQN